MKKKANEEVQGENKRLTPEEFTLLAIEKLKEPKYAGIHTVFSGYNAAFRVYFPGLDPIKVVEELAAEGKIEKRRARRGAVIYLPGTKIRDGDVVNTLKKMGIV